MSNYTYGPTTALTETITTTVDPTTTMDTQTTYTTSMVTSTTSPPTSTITTTTTTTDLTTSTTSIAIDTSTTTTDAAITTTGSTTTALITENTTLDPTTSTIDDTVTVTSSNSNVVTLTSTSFSVSATATSASDTSPKDPSSMNIAAIVGGVVGGVAFLAIIVAILFFFKRKNDKRSKENIGYEADNGIGAPPTAFHHDYNTYGSGTVISDNTTSLPSSSRPMSMNTNVSGVVPTVGGLKPRPFVQAYDPTHDEQVSQYLGYENSSGVDYQQFAYNNSRIYPRDNYHSTPYEPMIPNNKYEHNVPDENIYAAAPARRVSRHVPNEKE